MARWVCVSVCMQQRTERTRKTKTITQSKSKKKDTGHDKKDIQFKLLSDYVKAPNYTVYSERTDTSFTHFLHVFFSIVNSIVNAKPLEIFGTSKQQTNYK